MVGLLSWLIRKAGFVLSLSAFLAFLLAPAPFRWYALAGWAVPFTIRGYRMAVDQARLLGWINDQDD
jgi:Na+/H+ antiporter NhaA